MKSIVILNAYGYENIGDGAILDSAIDLINKAVSSDKNISIHIANPTHKIPYKKVQTIINPYGVAIKTTSGRIHNIQKIIRFTQIMSTSLFYILASKISPYILPKKGDYAYIQSLKNADIVFGIGGGYLRTKNKLTDLFGFLLTLLPILTAHIYNKKILFLPMSFGNFASPYHGKLATDLIKKDTIILRDTISAHEFLKYKNPKDINLLLYPDIALFTQYNSTNNQKEKNNYIVVTARNWLDSHQQKQYEKELASFIEYMWNVYELKTIFIPMAWNQIEEDDGAVGRRMKDMIPNSEIIEIKYFTSANEVKKLLSSAKLAICTRMHSAILSMIVNTPFITIAYEHKTNGLMKQLGLEDWNVQMEQVSFPLLKEKVDHLIKDDIYHTHKDYLSKRYSYILATENSLIKDIQNFCN